MTTPAELVAKGQLHKVEDVLDANEQEQRLLYALPRAKDWIEGTLPDLDTDGFWEGAPSPSQQADDLIYAYVVGDEEISEWEPHSMLPQGNGVWELRTADLRFFGWFWRKGVFIVSAVDQKARCDEFNLYAGFREQCVRDRTALGLDPPPFVTGEVSDVL